MEARRRCHWVTPGFAAEARFTAAWLHGHATAREALEAVASNPGVVIASDGITVTQWPEGGGDGGGDGGDAKQRSLRPGEHLMYQAEDGERQVQVVTVLEGVGSAGLFVHPDVVAEVAHWHGSTDQAGTRIWAEASPGVDPEALAAALEGGLRRAGAEAYAVGASAREEAAGDYAMIGILEIFLVSV